MRRLIQIICILILPVNVLAAISVGAWRTHFSYTNTNQIVFADPLIYAQASGKLFSWNKDKATFKTYTQLDGLNGNTLSFIGWSAEAKSLILVYSDGNIDFLNSNTVINLPDFKNKSLTADKSIQGLRIEKGIALISTGVGLLMVDMQKKEFIDGYFLPLEVGNTTCKDALLWGDSVLFVTKTSLYVGDRTTNLQDRSFWSKVNFVSGTNVEQIVRFKNKFFALASNGVIYSGLPNNWTPFLVDASVTKIDVQDHRLLVCSSEKVRIFDENLIPITVEQPELKSVALDTLKNKLFIASGSKGISTFNFNGTSFELFRASIFPDGPALNSTTNAFFKDGVYFAAAGGRWANRFNIRGAALSFDELNWRNLIDQNELFSKIGYIPEDFLNIAIDPNDDSHYFITSWGDGLFEYRNKLFFKQYKDGNSPLRSVVPGRFCRVDGASFDNSGNLWVLNSKYSSSNGTTADSSLLILKKDGTWFQPFYAAMKSSPTWNSILFTKNGQVWMNSARYTNAGVFILDNNGSLENRTDDKTKMFTSFTDQDGKIWSPWFIKCMAEDKNGTVWIGSNIGPILASNTSNVFDANYTFSRVKIPRNDGSGYADFLLDNITINCIAIDGANRKWIGTEGDGVYLLSSDGIHTIHHFNKDNSPLPTNVIWSLAINPETGEVFIGTEAGLVSFRSDATEGKSDFQNVYVFPNPVQPNYNGLITVTGLLENTQVRITNLSGNTLIKGRSKGGQFTWNGLAYNGQKAASGVYLVFCASDAGTESQMCKFMIVR